MPEVVTAIVREIETPRFPFAVDESAEISTVYFGGGTPGLLPVHELAKILLAVRRHFKLTDAAEITLEVNPDNVNAQTLSGWRQMGINRLSMGVQSFHDEELIWMNRTHDAQASRRSIALAQDAGFQNITIDLIYGLPESTLKGWMKNLEQAVKLQIPHLSCYALTVEEKTALSHDIQMGRQLPPEDNNQANQFRMMVEYLQTAGFEQYEISNFAKPGWQSRHNSHYWSGGAYLGFGPAAHSFDGQNIRSWNIANNALYVQAINANTLPYEMETLSLPDRINEKILTHLRLKTGLPVDYENSTIGGLPLSEKQWRKFAARVEHWLNADRLTLQDDRLILRPEGLFFADGIAADLFLETE